MPVTYVNIASQTTSTGVSSVTFSSIPNTYTDLLVRFSIRNIDALNAIYIGLNGDSSALYSSTYAGGNPVGSTVSGRFSGNTELITPGGMVRSDYTANVFSDGELYIGSYTTSFNKPVHSIVASENMANAGFILMQAGLYRNTTALSSLSIRANNNFEIGSSFFLYGIKNS